MQVIRTGYLSWRDATDRYVKGMSLVQIRGLRLSAQGSRDPTVRPEKFAGVKTNALRQFHLC